MTATELSKEQRREQFYKLLGELNVNYCKMIEYGHPDHFALGHQGGMVRGAYIAGLITEAECDQLTAQFVAMFKEARLLGWGY